LHTLEDQKNQQQHRQSKKEKRPALKSPNHSDKYMSKITTIIQIQPDIKKYGFQEVIFMKTQQ
jgi:hypothetical protein